MASPDPHESGEQPKGDRWHSTKINNTSPFYVREERLGGGDENDNVGTDGEDVGV